MKIKNWTRGKTYQLIAAAIVVIGIATIGSVLLLKSHAASTLEIGVFTNNQSPSDAAAFATLTKVPVQIGADYLDGDSWETISNGLYTLTNPGAWTGSPYQLQLGVDMLPGWYVSNSVMTNDAAITGSTTSGSTTLTLSGSPSTLSNAIAVGDTVTDQNDGNLIPFNTTITAISGDTLTLSQAATATTSGQQISYAPWSLAQGATGAYNSYFVTLAQTLVNDGLSNAILHIGWEWDTGSDTWDIPPTTAAATIWGNYFKEIVTAMRTVPGANFNYSWYYSGQDGLAVNEAAFPGSNYVSSLDLDFYDQSWNGSCNLPYNITTVPTPSSELVTPTESNCIWNNGGLLSELNGYASFASMENEPMGFGEWGVITRTDGHGLGDDPTFVNNFTSWVKSHNVEYISYFDANSGGDSVLSPSTYPQSLAAYTADLSNLSGTGGSSTGSGSSTSGSGGGTVTTPTPTAPTSVSAEVNDYNSITVSWTPGGDNGGPGIGGYDVLRSTDGVNYTQVGTSTSTSYTDTGLQASTKYYYEIKTYDKSSPALTSSASVASTPVTTSAIPLPPAPTNVTSSSVTQTSATISWNAVTDTGGPGLKGYNVYVGTSTTPVNSSVLTGTSYTDSSLTAGTQYSFTVEAVDIDGNSSVPSTAAVFTTAAPVDTTPPSTPSGVSAKANSATSISVSWNASTDSTGGGGIKGYIVSRSTNGSSYTQVAQVTGLTFTDNTVSASTTYTYEVVAFDGAGLDSQPSTASSPVTTPAIPTAPNAPSGVSATAVSTSQINISWSETTSGVSSFNVYEVGVTNPIATVAGTVDSYGVTGLVSSTSYSFYVVAYNGTLASNNSSTVSATTEAASALSNYVAGTITGIDGKCLDNENGTTANFNPVVLWSCNGKGTNWQYNPNNGTITNSNGECLDVYYDGTTSGTKVDTYTCNGTPAQVWSVKGTPGKPGAIVDPHAGLCLDDQWRGTNNGNEIWVYTCNGTVAQVWTVN